MTEVIAAGQLDRLAMLHHTRNVVSARSIYTYVSCLRPFLQHTPAIMRIWVVRRSRGCITQSYWISILLSYPIQPAEANAPLSTMSPLVVGILHKMDSDGDYVLFPNCVRQNGCIVHFLIKCRSKLTGSVVHSSSGYSTRYSQHVLTRFEFVYMGEMKYHGFL